MNYLKSVFFGVKDTVQFYVGLKQMIQSLHSTVGTFAGDNLITIGKNLSFLEDAAFMQAVQRHVGTQVEQGIIWRMATVLWGARQGMRLDGDFVECACYKGTTARVVCDALQFAASAERHYYLYDLFDHDPSLPHHAMPEHSKQLYAWVRERFGEFPNVTVTQGRVPDVLHEKSPDKIAFMHLDLNNAGAEIGALELLFDRMVPGAVLILDDYGWRGYRAQKLAEDPWFSARGYTVMELPTGQGLLIK